MEATRRLLRPFGRGKLVRADDGRIDWTGHTKTPVPRWNNWFIDAVLAWYRRVTSSNTRGNYENRLKFASAPEKVFEYFASVKDEKKPGESFMTKADFLDSLLPFMFSQPCQTNSPLDHSQYDLGMTSSVFDIADTNRDGRISFAEYLFFTTMLSMPKEQFETAFKCYSSSFKNFVSSHSSGSCTPDEAAAAIALTKNEFLDMMESMMRRSSRGSKQRSSKAGMVSMPDPRGLSIHQDLAQLCTSALRGTLQEYLFGSEANGTTTWAVFEKLRSSLQHEILYTEFARCGPLEGKGMDASLQAGDFAKMFIAYVEPNQMESLSRRMSRLHFDDKRISFRTLNVFEDCVRKLSELSFAVEVFLKSPEMSGITKDGLVRVLAAVASDKTADFEALADVLFCVFDIDRSGTLEAEEFLTIVRLLRYDSYSSSRRRLPTHCFEQSVLKRVAYSMRLMFLDPFKFD
eukprot:GHVS01105089.1.p1 GENE.GHVS01105089.1~~GHVS01105089.1.p1  ORF type:complete len:460 (-),score=43.11 GHVS01105089.1:190-1569(-)